MSGATDHEIVAPFSALFRKCEKGGLTLIEMSML